jgi:hypothetical protein
MKRVFLFAAILAVFLSPSMQTVSGQDVIITIEQPDREKSRPKTDPATAPFSGTRPAVDVAILLDTSNSMDGLIGQAKSQLWNIVQQFADAKKNGMTPILRVSVFEYGNTSLPATEGYIRQVVPLTDDLDSVSQALFQLTTNGGDEYCGMVIDEALKRLAWSKEPNSYKAIFIAGNEPFTQGSVYYESACKKAIESGVVVNTIHCGSQSEGVAGKWQHGAELAEGKFLNIDQDRQVVHIKCPQDKIILELNTELNKTYLWFGAKQVRESYKGNQLAQDSNADSIGNSVARVQTKSSAAYSNLGRDLCDTMKEDEKVIDSVKTEDLPEELQKLTLEERKAYVQKMAAKREEIKQQLAKVNQEREAYLAAEQKQLAAAAKDTLGDAISNTVNEQLLKSGFEVPNRK